MACKRPEAALVVALALALIAGPDGSAQQTVRLTAGMVIERSITVRPGTYRLTASSDLTTPAITIRGTNITVDFNGAELAGAPDGADPDTMAGVGVLVDGGSKVTLKNATIRGYKVGILARKSPDLHVTHNDLSYNWKQRLYSGIEQESLVDWMSYHHNEKDEWLRYGAAIYLSACDRAEIDHTTVVQGQNGLMVTASKGLNIWNNTFQYLSAIGVGLYRVTDSTIMHNKIDWCVRGYSHGFYNRGQDSAGLLMYEQTSRNRVGFNSITHGGDGLFLWAGQSTMDTGQGGANDNVFFNNDFSHAPANGIEATFSRNTFVKNRIDECWHGVWGGYSYESLWFDNQFSRNQEGIAIEHGQSNAIYNNTFDRDETAIRLWQNAPQDPNWGYPKNHDTRSHGYVVFNNTFRGNKLALQIQDTADVKLTLNRFDKVTTTVSLAGSTPGFLLDPVEVGSRLGSLPDPPLAGGMDAMIKDGERRGRDTIIVDEWGPYDWKSPKLWPARRPGLQAGSDDAPLTLRVLGPAGDWKVASIRGATVTPQSGRVPGEMTLTPVDARPHDRASGKGDGPLTDYRVALEYRGAAVASPRGARTPAGQPSRFEYSRFFVPIDWHIRLFEYAAGTDPVTQPDEFGKLLTGTPLKDVTHDRLDYLSGGAIESGVPRDTFALVADGTADLPAGDYTIRVISDDGARVWVDGELVIDAWEPHESRVDRAPLSGGRRRVKIAYYEVGGFAELRFDIQRK